MEHNGNYYGPDKGGKGNRLVGLEFVDCTRSHDQ